MAGSYTFGSRRKSILYIGGDKRENERFCEKHVPVVAFMRAFHGPEKIPVCCV